MHVKGIEMRGFMKHTSCTMALPDRGIVKVTGPNGSGKSSFVEAVAMALWGKTLRGTSPWNKDAGTECFATADTDIVGATRFLKGSKTRLNWNRPGKDVPEFESTSKAQEMLEEIVGTMDLWAYTHVFSSQDATRFTLATDAERKRLLEQILGLDQFDVALGDCRDARRKLENAESTYAQSIEFETRRAQELADNLARLKSTTAPADGGKPALTPAEYAELEKGIASNKIDSRKVDDGISLLRNAGSDGMAQSREAKRRLDALSHGECPTCGQAVPEKLVKSLQKEVDMGFVAAEKARKEAEVSLAALNDELEELREEYSALREKQDAARNADRVSEKMREATRNMEAELARLAKDVEGSKARLADVKKRHTESAQSLAEERAAEMVLGTKGVRANVLGRALTGIETVSNRWLGKLGGDEQIKLSPVTEKKTGGESSAISLVVEGAGGGYGYKGASGGERRRVDVALMLALSEVAAASRGVTQGTLWFDEVFDALDVKRQDDVVRVLEELAKNRAVVVITHNAALVKSLPGQHAQLGG